MPKIKVNRLPDGYQIKDGKISKKEMQKGGNVGDQDNYSLSVYPAQSSDPFNRSGDNSVRYSLSAVPKEIANIEAEGGETVLTDLSNDGMFGLYNINGPRHGSGGVPMYLPEQSFVFSDTQKMKLKRPELAEFGIESKKQMTPADVSKKFNLNKYYGAMNDDFADKIQAKSAELMLDKNMNKLSKLSFIQEFKKNFEDGVPLAAYPYIMAQGQDPFEFVDKIESMVQKKSQTSALSGAPFQKQNQVDSLKALLSQFENSPMMQEGGETLATLFANTNDSEWQNTVDAAYEMFKANLKSNGITEVPSKKEMIDHFLKYQDANYAIKGKASDDERKHVNLDKDNKYTQELFNKHGIDYTIDPKITKYNQAFFQALIILDAQSPNPRLSVTYEGPNQNTNWKSNKEISNVDGKYGNNTLNQFVSVAPKKEQPKEKTKDVEKDPRPDIEVPNLKAPYQLPDPAFYTQDLIKAANIALRERQLRMPWQPPVNMIQTDYELEDPTRAIAANNEVYNITADALGAFAGPQSMNARLSEAAGRTMNQNAQTLAEVNSRNIGTINRGELANAQFRQAAESENRERRVKEYDDTQLVLDNYMNEKNFDREQLGNQLANMYTNMANTYNLNSLYPNFAIDPKTGGMIGNVSTKKIEPNKNANATNSEFKKNYDFLIERGIEPTPEWMKYLSGMSVEEKDDNSEFAELSQNVIPKGAKKGKEVRKSFIPFYMGKIGL